MSLMNTLNKKLKYLDSNAFKNMIIIFGFCISFITITSFESVSNSSQSDVDLINKDKNIEVYTNQKVKRSDKKTIQSKQKIKARHNFIASYLLQESSHKRENNKTSQEGSFFRNLKHIQKTIIVNAVESF